MKSKKILLLSIIIMLNACIPLRVVSKWDPDIYNNYTVIQAIQKKETIGYTDIKQREIDLRTCGVKNFFNGTLDFNVRYPGMTSSEVTERSKKITNCMKEKGYIFDDRVNCTNNGKATGLCN